ncbi:hypothetical protein ASPACDRAFT_116805 [Aspergillus aculeatus ATCC 16872]|uniref:NADH dehydrogenase [ubiquinone] 1 beta subcomplex subunit 9 n=1 Tax=Aspergillus aculeatus (strain ATCC 16872 / CBS 172.66 / WB 5094) TaxID=690307 RepID=A0A1L9WWK6_ASPA1|nr:uncharacterized protein ASPACDRAFT_116805 [Aspergillus aculeatus ATCC 16872]OJK00602.1 hypothetical protein ASPACDRAFT_116805 [Aspergillus aculeatus ATCC 16872]
MPLSAAASLYRRSLKLALDWAVHRQVWRGQAVYIRSLFDANKDVRDPRQQKVLLQETEKLLETWKHPDPYRAPTAPGGSKWERNLPAPQLPRKFIRFVLDNRLLHVVRHVVLTPISRCPACGPLIVVYEVL